MTSVICRSSLINSPMDVISVESSTSYSEQGHIDEVDIRASFPSYLSEHAMRIIIDWFFGYSAFLRYELYDVNLVILPGKGWHGSFAFEQPALRCSGLFWPLCAVGRKWRHALLLGPGIVSWWQPIRICDRAGDGCPMDRADEMVDSLPARSKCLQWRLSGRDGGHGTSLASACWYSSDGDFGGWIGGFNLLWWKNWP